MFEQEGMTVAVNLLPFLLFSATAATAQIEARQLDILLILDVRTETDFNAGMMVTQDMDFTPKSSSLGSFVTVVSNDREAPLIQNQLAPFSKGVKADLSGKRFNSEITKRLDLSKLATIYNGHFNNEEPTHIVSEVCVILTTYRDIEGDTALLEQLRKKKTYVVAIGFQKQAFSAVWSSLAANDEHVMELKNKNALMERIRILVSKDSEHGCDTDMYRRHGYEHCSDRCINVCFTDALARMCVDNCPYYKEINYGALDKINEHQGEPNNIIRIGLPVGIAALVVIIFLILCYCNKKVNLAVRLTYQKVSCLWQGSGTRPRNVNVEAATPLNSNTNESENVYTDNSEIRATLDNSQGPINEGDVVGSTGGDVATEHSGAELLSLEEFSFNVTALGGPMNTVHTTAVEDETENPAGPGEIDPLPSTSGTQESAYP